MTIDNNNLNGQLKFWVSLKFKVPMVSFVIALVVAVTMSLTSYHESAKILKQEAEQELAENAAFVTGTVKRYFNVNFEDIAAISRANLITLLVDEKASTSHLTNESASKRQFNAAFSSLMSTKTKFVAISLVSTKGEVIAEQHTVTNSVQQQIINHVVNRNSHLSSTKNTYFQRVQAINEQRSLMVTVSPMYVAEQHVASLVIVFDLASLNELLTEFLKAGEYAFIADNEGSIIYQNENSIHIEPVVKKWQAQLNGLTGQSSEGQLSLKGDTLELQRALDNSASQSTQLSTSKQIVFDEYDHSLTLNLLIYHEDRQLNKAFEALEERVFLLGVVLAIIAFLLSIFAARKIIDPLANMLFAIGEYESKGEILSLPTGKLDETGQLARSFQRLLHHVEQQKKSMHQTLTESQETSARLKSILNSITDAVVNFDETGHIVAFNRSAEDMFGYRSKEILGKHLTELLPHDTAEKFAEIAAEFSDANSACRSHSGKELSAMRKDGEVFPIIFVVSQLTIEQGVIYTGLIRDNTYFKLLESERKLALRDANELAWRLDFALSAPQIGVWEYNRLTGRVSWDKRMYHLYGYQQNDGVLPEQIWLKAVHAKDRQIVDDAIARSFSTGEDFNVTFRINMPNGEVNYIESHAKALVQEDTETTRLVGTNRNITEQRLLHDLKQQALDMAQESLRAKSEFLASMSHEIRTPMNGVMGMLGLLEQSDLSAKQRHYMKLANASALSLLNLINDILDFSKVEAGKLELEILDFDLRSHLGDIAESMAIKAQDKGVEVILDVSQISLSLVKGDPTRLRQIISNLVDNAIKFTERGEVVIRAKLSPALVNGKDVLKFECQIIDTGIGIADSKLDKLFDSFTQVDASTTRRYGGTGLGLAIVKKLCLLMNGGVQVESTLGVGSKFTFNLIMQRSEQKPLAIPDISFLGHNVLVIDDNKTTRSVVAEQLSTWGASVVTAESGACAKGIIAKRPEGYFEVAILDRQLSDIDGVTLGQQLKADPKASRIKLIMMTSMSERGDSNYFASLGYSAYFPKPATSSDLHNAMALVLSKESSSADNSHILTHYNVNPSCDPEVQDSSFKLMRILLVEDNRINQAVVQGILGNGGGRADIANHGKEALEQLLKSPSNEPYDVILMDCQMPEMDGYQATKAIRQGQAGSLYKEVPIIAMTANAMKGDREKCMAVGMNDYLSKPVDADILSQTLCRWVKKSESNIKKANISSSKDQISVSEVAKTPKSSPLWDKQALFNRVRNNEQLVRNLVELYINDVPVLFDQLIAALAQNDMENTLALAHKLKGSSNNLGGTKLAEIALKLEHAAKAENVEQLLALTKVLEITYLEFTEHLKSFLSQPVKV